MGMTANRTDRVFFKDLIAQVFEPGETFFAAAANDDIKITVKNDNEMLDAGINVRPLTVHSRTRMSASAACHQELSSP